MRSSWPSTRSGSTTSHSASARSCGRPDARRGRDGSPCNLLDQRTQQAETIALEQLIDGQVQAELAAEQGVTVTTRGGRAAHGGGDDPGIRHAWLIEVAPEVPAGALDASDAPTAAAKAKAEAALTAPPGRQGLDRGSRRPSRPIPPRTRPATSGPWTSREAEAQSPPRSGPSPNTPTDVIEGDDGTYRIGRVTEIVAPSGGPQLPDKITADGASMDEYRARGPPRRPRVRS